MKRISFRVKQKTSSEIFNELDDLFGRYDYKAATTGFDPDGIPNEVIILTDSIEIEIETYLVLRYSVTDDLDNFEVLQL